MKTLSVIIPAYNRLEDVMKCLASLQRNASLEVPIEFLVQDDCSPDISLAAFIPACAAKTARNPANLGFAGNVNAAASRAVGDILFLVNQDVYAVPGMQRPGEVDEYPFSPGWDKAIVDAFERDETVGIVGAKLLTPTMHVQSVGGLFDIAGQPFHRCLGYSDHTDPDCNTGRYVSWVTGAALAIPRDLFFAVGGLDTAYIRGYWEDVDLCMKVKAAGKNIWYEPTCQLIHTVGTTGGNPAFMRNAALFKSRWVDTGIVQSDTYMLKEHFWA